MDRPLGIAIGNGLETVEAIACLKGAGPGDLRELVVTQAAEMLVLSDSELSSETATARAASALDSGDALERFVCLVEAQGGDAGVVDEPGRLETAPLREEVRAEERGIVTAVAPRTLGEGVVQLGGGRLRMDQEIDLGVGFEVRVRPGEEVTEGDLIGVVHARLPEEARAGAAVLHASVLVGEAGSSVKLRTARIASHRWRGPSRRPGGVTYLIRGIRNRRLERSQSCVGSVPGM